MNWATESLIDESRLEVFVWVLVAADQRWHWRRRWQSYRLLAELLREADLLAQIGRVLPANDLARIGEDPLDGRIAPQLRKIVIAPGNRAHAPTDNQGSLPFNRA